MNTVFIYTLNDPDSGEVRYVGKTNNPKKRFRAHICEEVKSSVTTHKAHWMRALLATGKRPVLIILDEVLESEWQAAECAYIQFFREEGCQLVNGTEGGDGSCNPNDEVRFKMGNGSRGTKWTAERRARQIAAQTGRKYPPEFGQAISRRQRGSGNSGFGKKRSPEAIAKQSASMLGRKHLPETIARMRVAAVKRGVSDACREAQRKALTGKPPWNKGKACPTISAAQKGKKKSPEHCAAMRIYQTGRTRPAEVCATMKAAQQLRRANEAASKLAAQSLPPSSPDNPS